MRDKEIKIEPEKVIRVSPRMISESPKPKNEITNHTTWFKRTFNPILRRFLNIEICSIMYGERVVGYGIRKQLKS